MSLASLLKAVAKAAAPVVKIVGPAVVVAAVTHSSIKKAAIGAAEQAARDAVVAHLAKES